LATWAPRASIEQRLATAGLPPLPRTAWLELDLDALAANLGVIRELAGPGTAVHPVVKADAYGHGAVPVARALAAAGADGFCVAAFDEAVQLRDAGIELPVLVLFPIPGGLVSEAARRGIAVTVGDGRLLEELLRAGEPALDVHLEVETGLGRGGFEVAELATAAARVAAAPGPRLAGLWTHLQAAEDPALTTLQLRRFEAAADAVRAAGIPLPARHAAASGGLLLGNVASLDAVRPGLTIYGLLPDELAGQTLPSSATRLRPVLSLLARPVRVADLPAGWGISYGPTFRTTRPSRIATLPLGYGDGWPRSLSNRATALVRGRRVPLVGNVAMDAVMADVTDVPGPPVSVEDEFVLIGAQGDAAMPVAELATLRGTNSWEVVTAMAARLPRVYHAPSGPRGIRTLVMERHR
jgi:alanine racemase